MCVHFIIFNKKNLRKLHSCVCNTVYRSVTTLTLVVSRFNDPHPLLKHRIDEIRPGSNYRHGPNRLRQRLSTIRVLPCLVVRNVIVDTIVVEHLPHVAAKKCHSLQNSHTVAVRPTGRFVSETTTININNTMTQCM
jgi:hypothetical protein